MESRPPVSIEELQKETGWIRELARGLIGDADVAEDVVQHTLTAALSKPPRQPSKIRAWSQSVVRNFIRNFHRDRERRRRRERQVSRRERQPAPRDETEVAELRRRVATAVFELDEPYRSTIIGLYYYELTPPELARRQGTSSNTVRVRARRALELLKIRLDRAYRGDRSDWVAGLLVVLGPTMFLECLDTVHRSPRFLADASGSAGSGTPPAHGVPGARPATPPTAVRTTLIGAGILVLMMGLGLLIERATSVAPATGPELGAATPGDGQEGSGVTPAATSAPERRFAPGTPASSVPTATLMVRDARTGRAIPSAEVRTQAFDMRSENLMRGRDAPEALARPHARNVRGRTDAAGSLTLPAAVLRHERLCVSAPGYLEHREQSRIRELSGGSYTVDLQPAPTTVVSVRDTDARPMVDLPVAIDLPSGVHRVVSTDAQGRVELTLTERFTILTLEADGHVARRLLAEAPRQEITLVPGSAATGHVLDPWGDVLPGARVSLAFPPFWRGQPWTTTRTGAAASRPPRFRPGVACRFGSRTRSSPASRLRWICPGKRIVPFSSSRGPRWWGTWSAGRGNGSPRVA